MVYQNFIHKTTIPLINQKNRLPLQIIFWHVELHKIQHFSVQNA